MPDLHCPQCERSFGQSSALTSHLKKCKELQKELHLARANLASSRKKDKGKTKKKIPDWVGDLEVDAPAVSRGPLRS